MAILIADFKFQINIVNSSHVCYNRNRVKSKLIRTNKKGA